jgi:hypothetical protein
MWGNWAENKAIFSEKAKAIYDCMGKPGIEVPNILLPNDQMVWLSWKHAEENITLERCENVGVASYLLADAWSVPYSRSTLPCDALFCCGTGCHVRTGSLRGAKGETSQRNWWSMDPMLT